MNVSEILETGSQRRGGEQPLASEQETGLQTADADSRLAQPPQLLVATRIAELSPFDMAGYLRRMGSWLKALLSVKDGRGFEAANSLQILSAPAQTGDTRHKRGRARSQGAARGSLKKNPQLGAHRPPGIASQTALITDRERKGVASPDNPGTLEKSRRAPAEPIFNERVPGPPGISHESLHTLSANGCHTQTQKNAGKHDPSGGRRWPAKLGTLVRAPVGVAILTANDGTWEFSRLSRRQIGRDRQNVQAWRVSLSNRVQGRAILEISGFSGCLWAGEFSHV
ncbi:hypothetical protein B0J18DRAFT_299072 [Chaetomium sp. MPI-SDFR-AT-0129]|nr:hypothetical protein B0J18DRAFT_299072 [Chaetomium sp. MPI-SDFR-AT-0129]